MARPLDRWKDVLRKALTAYESRLNRKNYDYGKVAIVAHTPATLVRALAAEVGQPRAFDTAVAAQVWKLARVAE